MICWLGCYPGSSSVELASELAHQGYYLAEFAWGPVIEDEEDLSLSSIPLGLPGSLVDDCPCAALGLEVLEDSPRYGFFVLGFHFDPAEKSLFPSGGP